MHLCLRIERSSGLSSWSASFAFRPLPFVYLYRPIPFCSSVLSLVTLSRAARGSGPVFDTHTTPDPTPCEPIRFSWTGGVPPFTLFLGDPDTTSIVSEIDDINERFVTWAPPADTVEMTLIAFVFDDNESYDTTNEFVVQPAACLSASPPTSSGGAEPSTASPMSGAPRIPHSIPPIRSSAVSPAAPSPSPSISTHTAPSNTPSPSSPPAQPSNEMSTWPTGNSTIVVHPTTGTPSGTETLHPSTSATISHWRFGTSRPRRKPPSESPSPSPSEIVGIVLGSVALLSVLVGLLVWRRVAVARGSTAGRGGTSRGSAAGEDSPSGSSSQLLFLRLIPSQNAPENGGERWGGGIRRSETLENRRDKRG